MSMRSPQDLFTWVLNHLHLKIISLQVSFPNNAHCQLTDSFQRTTETSGEVVTVLFLFLLCFSSEDHICGDKSQPVFPYLPSHLYHLRKQDLINIKQSFTLKVCSSNSERLIHLVRFLFSWFVLVSILFPLFQKMARLLLQSLEDAGPTIEIRLLFSLE